MYEKQFLHDIANQNYTKYNIDVPAITSKTTETTKSFVCNGKELKQPENWLHNLESADAKGKLYVVNKRHVNEIIQTATAVVCDIWLSKPFMMQTMKAHLPVYDPVVKGNLIRYFIYFFISFY